MRVVALEDEAAAARERSKLLADMGRRAKGKPGRKGGIHVHDVPQASLRPEFPWPVKYSAEDVAPRVVAHLQQGLDQHRLERLAESWKVFLGIQTGADTYSTKARNRLKQSVRTRLEASGARLGDPVYGLPAGVETVEPWVDHPAALVQSPEPEAVLYGLIDEADYVNLVWLTASNPPSEPVLREIEPWKPLLAERAEFVRNPRRSWWETCWPRNPNDLNAPKVIALHRTDRGRFALDEAGEWSPSGRMSVVIGRRSDAPVAYLCGLLNSELLDLWYAVRGRRPRDIWRDYEPKPMGEIPYRPPEGDERVDRVAALVREIAANRRTLLSHRVAAPRLAQVIKDPWLTGPYQLEISALIAELPPAETMSVRIHPGIRVTGEPSGKARRKDRRTLVFRRRAETGQVGGDPALIDMLERLIPVAGIDDATSVVVPRDFAAFDALLTAKRSEIDALLAQGRELIERVERLVCSLYGVPDELTEEVVQHAVARAAAKTLSE